MVISLLILVCVDITLLTAGILYLAWAHRRNHRENVELLVQIEEYARQSRHRMKNLTAALRLSATPEESETL